MCWHGLPAYWGGIMPGAPALEGVSSARIVYPKPTEGIAEIEPSLMWSPAVLAGAGRCVWWSGRGSKGTGGWRAQDLLCATCMQLGQTHSSPWCGRRLPIHSSRSGLCRAISIARSCL